MNIVFLQNSKGKIPQKLHETESLNLDYLANFFGSKGFNTMVFTFDDFINRKDLQIKDTYFMYASSQYTEYKNYIEDVLLYIVNQKGILIPDFNLFRCHDNKFYQELFKYNKDICSPKVHLVGTYEEAAMTLKNVSYPLVAKTISGFGSKGVAQINSYEEGLKYCNKNMTKEIGFGLSGLRNLGRRLKFKNQYPKKTGRVIFQEKIASVDHDWKILIFGNRCFCLKRYVRKNDFRASGSGNFDFDAKPSEQLLTFAYNVNKKLNSPWSSLDIIEKNDEHFLIEFQSLHFGLATALSNKYVFEFSENNGWERKENDKEVEYYFAQALLNYIENKNDKLEENC